MQAASPHILHIPLSSCIPDEAELLHSRTQCTRVYEAAFLEAYLADTYLIALTQFSPTTSLVPANPFPALPACLLESQGSNAACDTWLLCLAALTHVGLGPGSRRTQP